MVKSKFIFKIFILCISIMLVLPLSFSVYATSTELQDGLNKTVEPQETVEQEIEIVDDLDKQTKDTVEDLEEIIMPEFEKINELKKQKANEELDLEEIIIPELEIIDDFKKERKDQVEHELDKNINLMENLNDEINNLDLKVDNRTSNTVYYSGAIPTEGESAYIYPIYVAPNNILQTQLQCPMSDQLDYDLYLYEFDMDTGNLIPTPIDYSIYGTYFNNGATLSENVGTKNTTTGDKAYLVEIYAKQGASINEEFHVGVSISDTYDDFETDENGLHAYAVTVATGGSSIVSRCINSEIDNDWYYIDVPSDRNYDAINFTLDSTSVNNGYDVDVYYAITGNKMVLVSKCEIGNVPLDTGRYYFHVYTTDSYAAGTNYNLTMKPVLRPEKIVITGYNSKSGPDDYPSYRYGRGYRIQGNYFVVNGVVGTSDNYAVANTKVEVNWENPSWSVESGNRYRTGTAYTNSHGEFTIRLNMPPAVGSRTQIVGSFRHYYDICGVGAFVVDNPSINDIDDLIYHFAYSILR